jgi:hypothetical protein
MAVGICDQEHDHRRLRKLTIPVTVPRSYRQADIKVFLSTGKNEADYAR